MVAFTLYKGFLIAEYSETDVRAYRNRSYYAMNIPSYYASCQSYMSQKVDAVNDRGDFSSTEYNALMQQLGRTDSSDIEQTTEQPQPRYPDHIMAKVRQKLGLEDEYDTSKDAQINDMSKDEIFKACLEWEGIIGYDCAIRSWVEEIFDVKLR